MSDVKEVKVTSEYLGLIEDARKCQNVERFEECTTREYFKAVKEECKCVPYGLKQYSLENQVSEPNTLTDN